MYVALSEDPIRIIGRPPPIEKPPVQPGDDGSVIPSWARGIIAIGLVGGALVFMIRLAEEQEKIAWRGAR